jgi:uncharacterized RDD family membrane protein YckC
MEGQMRWYYAEGGKKVGPLAEADIRRLAHQGKITRNTPVWNQGISKWVPFGALAAGASGGASPVQEQGGARGVMAARATATAVKQAPEGGAVCSQCRGSFREDEVLRYGESTICASCKPVFFQKLKEGAALPSSLQYAGFWIRFGAKFIDSVILGFANMILTAVSGLFVSSSYAVGAEQQAPVDTSSLIAAGVAFFFQIAVQIFYTTFFVGKYAATPGKMACRIKIVTPEGERVSYGRAFGRYFGEMLSGITLGIGYIMAAFDDEKRSLHDRVCSTRVVRK